jgi:hypothetical protein
MSKIISLKLNFLKKLLGILGQSKTLYEDVILMVTSVACDIGPSVNPFQNSGNSTYENCFVVFRI